MYVKCVLIYIHVICAVWYVCEGKAGRQGRNVACT